MVMRCGDCKYYQGFVASCELASETCRKSPPVVEPFKRRWPHVDIDDWCGEFEPNTPAPLLDIVDMIDNELRCVPFMKPNFAARAMVERGIKTIRDLCMFSETEIARWPMVGEKSIPIIKRHLAIEHGMSLAPSRPAAEELERDRMILATRLKGTHHDGL